jgi:hypothetical protein
MTLSPEDQELFKGTDGFIKYVRVGEQFRFTENRSHASLLSAGEKAVSAGFIYFCIRDGQKIYKIAEEWSSTVRLGPDYGPDKALLEKLFEAPVFIPDWIIVD